MSGAIYVDPSVTAGVIRVGGSCYRYVGPSDQAPQVGAGDVQGIYASCDACLCTCYIPPGTGDFYAHANGIKISGGINYYPMNADPDYVSDTVTLQSMADLGPGCTTGWPTGAQCPYASQSDYDAPNNPMLSASGDTTPEGDLTWYSSAGCPDVTLYWSNANCRWQIDIGWYCAQDPDAVVGTTWAGGTDPTDPTTAPFECVWSDYTEAGEDKGPTTVTGTITVTGGAL